MVARFRLRKRTRQRVSAVFLCVKSAEMVPAQGAYCQPNTPGQPKTLGQVSGRVGYRLVPAARQTSELLFNQLMQLLMRQRPQLFSTHQNDVERWPIGIVQTKNFPGTALDPIAGYGSTDVFFGENKPKPGGACLSGAGQEQQFRTG